MKKYLLVVLICFVHALTHAQEEPEKNHLQWAIHAKLGTETISHISNNEDIFAYRKMPLLFGGIAKYQKLETDIDFSLWYFSTRINYQLLPYIFIGTAASFSKNNIEIDRTDYNYTGSFIFTEGEVNYQKYTFNIGYNKVFFRRLDLRAYISLGSLSSNTSRASGYIDTNYSTNKVAQKNDTYKLNPSFIYGAEISLFLLPDPIRHCRFPVCPFFTLSFMGRESTNLNRTISIEEWVPGNIVYFENSEKSKIDYDVFSFKGQVGIRWYLHY